MRWTQGHTSQFTKNYKGTSTGMEEVVAGGLFEIIELFGYVSFVRDGDSDEVTAMENGNEPYQDHQVKKKRKKKTRTNPMQKRIETRHKVLR